MGNRHGTTPTSDEKEEPIQQVNEDEFIREELAANEVEWRISDEQKVLLRESWHLLQTDMESIGTVTFLRMFETHPETLTAFIPEVEHIRELELDEWYREKLKVHAIRVMTVIEKTMHRLDSEHQAASSLQVYGRRHCGFGVTRTMLDKMGNSFVIAIQPYLEERWTQKMEDSWHALFSRIVFFMRLGYPREAAAAECLKAGGPECPAEDQNGRASPTVAAAD